MHTGVSFTLRELPLWRSARPMSEYGIIKGILAISKGGRESRVRLPRELIRRHRV